MNDDIRLTVPPLRKMIEKCPHAIPWTMTMAKWEHALFKLIFPTSHWLPAYELHCKW